MSNKTYFERACLSIPGGVNSPVRAFQGVGGTPIFIQRGYGPYIWDHSGNKYIDYIGSWGGGILGHAHPKIIKTVQKAAELGLSFGAPTQAETKLAETLIFHLPSIKLIRLVNSGTEATMTAVRLARGVTQRKKIIKFDGCYHGHSDSLLVKGGSALLTLGNPSSEGIPSEFIANTIVLEFNNFSSVELAFEKYGKDVACVILEPIAANMNLIKPSPNFLEYLREICTYHGALLIFDEVITGFRVGLQGAQGLFNINPDLTTLAKIIGGGLPMGAIGGSLKAMKNLAPLGKVYQAGTLSGNPIAVAAGLETINLISQPNFYEFLTKRTQELSDGINKLGIDLGIQIISDSIGGLLGIYFGNEIPNSLREFSKYNLKAFTLFFHEMLKRGVYLPPSPFETCFLSIFHDTKIIQETLDIIEKSLLSIKKKID